MITEETEQPPEHSDPVKKTSRPVLLTTLCLAALVFFGLLTLLFLAGLIKSGWITEVTNQYLRGAGYTGKRLFLFFGSAFLLHGLSVAGVILIWQLKRIGYYIFGLSCLVIAAWQVFNPDAPVISTGIYIVILLLFGLFYRRLN